ncbi:DUF5979 domain-containing protein [Microbacterium pumilum]|uniref:Gram-positive cocci surface proteins LPxTG domain-containing protein n=1 Tax=Microbacterium pumilum TaxID=344165 RepID=A0ABN2S4C2_9MICO
MAQRTARKRLRSVLAMLVVGVVAASSVLYSSTVGPVPAASAATVSLGTVQGQLANQEGVDNGTSGNCIRYSPANTSTSSGVVAAPNEALTAHGRPGQSTSSCPANLSTSSQSAVGFRPSSVSSVTDGAPFLIGRMVHYNNPVYADDRYFTGDLRATLTGFASPNTLTFNWTLDETPNTGAGNCCNDILTFTNQISNVTLSQGGLTFKLVMLGFIGTGTSTTCPVTPVGTPQNVFSTVEGTQTHACMYAAIAQERSLRIVKNVVGSPPGAPSFAFTSTSTLDGSPWSNSAFNLANGGTVQRSLVSGNTVTVAETDPGDDRWSLSALVCQEYNAAGQLVTIPGSTNVAARKVTLANVPPPAYLPDPSITCTFTNTYTPRTTLTLVKQVQGGAASPALWTLTATGTSGAAAGTVISGPSGSDAVTSKRVIAGTYQLSEQGTGAAETGFVQVGNWTCTAGGTSYPVTATGIVTLPDLPAATTVTCAVVNRQATGSLQISKVVDDPVGGYTGGATKTFSGTYDCGAGYSGTFTTLTTSAPVTVSGIPAGRSCLVTENPPTGGLLNASFAWGAPAYSTQPVTVSDQQTATVTITNQVEQRFGTFAVTKSVEGPGGYIGGSARVFPVAYSCTLTNGPTTSGTINATTATATTPTAPIPAGSVCSFSETLTTQPDDFADPSYAWTGSAIAPTSVTIGDGASTSITVTNTYARETGELIIAKVVDGDGYIGTGEPFVVTYDCGVARGQVTVASGGSTSVTVPAGNSCAVQEQTPDPGLLSPAYVWGTPTWAPGITAIVPANGSATLTVTNPTIAVFGTVRVTKSISGETAGVTAQASFDIGLSCDNGYTATIPVGVGGAATTPDLPVGTTCDISETSPTGGLIDGSYAWGNPVVSPASVTITDPGQVVAVTVDNPVVRVTGALTITKAVVAPDGVVDPGRVFDITYSCVYGADAPVSASVALTEGSSQTVTGLLLGSTCTVREDDATLVAPPNAGDPSYVWLPPSYDPGTSVVVESATTPAAVTVTNTVDRLDGTFRLTKSVVGAGKDAGYDGGGFTFSVVCSLGGATLLDDIAVIADGENWAPPDGVDLPLGTTCTIAETATPDPTSPAFGWDPVEFSIGGAPAGGPSVDFALNDATVPVQINATNPITPRTGSVGIQKDVTGEVGGLAAGATFVVNLNCGLGFVYQVTVPADGIATQSGIPAGSTCVAVEAPPDPSQLVDASYAWGPPVYTPADATIAVPVDGTATVQVENPIERVLVPLRLVKTVAGAQGVVDPDQTYPVTWSCTYGGSSFGGSVDVTAGAAGVELADDVPVTADCSATEGDLGAPSADPAFRWLAATVTGVTVSAGGPNVITVANTLVRDSGSVLVRKLVTGQTQGYVNLGGGADDFTLHGSCTVPDAPEIATRYADGVIADGGEVPITASIGWTCSGYEDTPSNDLLVDSSYAWGAPVLTWGPAADTQPPAPTPENTGPFVLTRDDPTIAFWAVNPIVRVSSPFQITKDVVDPFGAVDSGATFTGTYSCVYGTDAPITGVWSLVAGGTFTGPDVLLESVCTVTEDDPGTEGLPDASFEWLEPTVSDPVTVVAGGTATVTVTNTVGRLYAGLDVAKVLVDPDGGVVPDAAFAGTWTCLLGDAVFSDRFAVTANATVTAFAPADERVPASAVCTITEDTPDPADLVDGSFGWNEPTYSPDDVELTSGETALLSVANSVHRVYSNVRVVKAVTGPGSDLVPVDRVFTGTVTCVYGSDDPVVGTWQATTAAEWEQGGILVGSVCTATEDVPGAQGQPVEGDPSYTWEPAIVSGPIVVTRTNRAIPDVELAPPILVTNPIRRVFGEFFLTKLVTGNVEGIVDRSQSYPMTWECVPGTGDPLGGDFALSEGERIVVGPDTDPPVTIPVGSVCTLTEPLTTMPALLDDAWHWNAPGFTVEGLASQPEPVTEPCDDSGTLPCLGARAVVISMPHPQEDIPDPTIGLEIINSVDRSAGAFSVHKTSDPPTGTTIRPGDAVTYTITVDSTGTVPVHDVVVTDDLAAVLPFGAVSATSPPTGTAALVDAAASKLVWTIGTLTPGQSVTLTYRLTVAGDAWHATIRNAALATADVPPSTCADLFDPACTTEHNTPPKPPPLPPTGGTIAVAAVWVGAGLLILGTGVVFVVRSRRRTDSAPER